MIQYPSAIDDSITLPEANSQTPLSPVLFNNLREAIYQIEKELGVVPRSIYGNVRARLDAMDGKINNSVFIGGDIGGTNVNPLVIGIDGTPISISSLQNNQALVYDSFNEVWTNKLINMDNLQPPFTIALSSLDGNLLEVGETLANAEFSAEYTDGYLYFANLTTDQDGYIQNVLATPESFSSEYSYVKNSFGESVIFTLSASPFNNPGLMREKSITFRWGQKSYWDALAEPVTIDNSFIQGLSNSELTLVKEKSFQLTAGLNQYIYFSCRAGFGDMRFLVNDFEGGFAKVAQDIEVNGEMYDVYRSDNPNLGDTSVIVF